MKVDLTKKQTKTAVKKSAENTETAIASPTPLDQVPAVYQPDAGRTYIEDEEYKGELGGEDVRRPFISIVPQTGKKVEAGFRPGQLLLRGETVLREPGKPLEIIVLSFEKVFKETEKIIPGEDRELDFKDARSFDKAEDVIRAGGSLDKNDHIYFSPDARLLLLVKKPEDATDEVGSLCYYTDEDGEEYMIAGMEFSKSAFNAVIPVEELKKHGKSTRSMRWILTTRLVKYNGFSWQGPRLQPAGPVTEAQEKFMASGLL